MIKDMLCEFAAWQPAALSLSARTPAYGLGANDDRSETVSSEARVTAFKYADHSRCRVEQRSQ
jgi:hypothetical protein